MYGPPPPPHHHHPAPTHHYYDQEFRSNSANLPLPPPVEYVWSSRPTRRTKSSAHPRQHRQYYHPRHPPSPQFYPPEPPPLIHHNSFARRFYNDREHKTDSFHVKHPSPHHSHHHHQQHQHNVLIEPDVHDASHHSLVSQLLVSRPPSSHSSHRSHSQERTSRPGSRPGSRPSSRPSSSQTGQFRVISDLLPQSTFNIQSALVSSGVGQSGHHGHSGHHASCTCYQCHPVSSHSSLETRTKAPLASLVSDINSNLVISGNSGQ